MSILPLLIDKKGTISSALGKSLAREALRGDKAILAQAVELMAHEDKNVRAGAVKIVEQVRVADPALVGGYLPRLLPALDLPEPQTRWMAIHTLGICASLDTETAMSALPKAEEYVGADSGTCLWGATVVYLGYLGATSEEHAQMVFPVLERTLHRIPGQTKNVLGSFLRILDRSDAEIRGAIAEHAAAYADAAKPGTIQMARKVQKQVEIARDTQ
jgi:hypothetical protein